MPDVIVQRDGFRVRRADSQLYVMDVSDNLSRALVAEALDAVWAVPDWAQPWGLVVVVSEDVTYDADVRGQKVPPQHQRAVGTAIVTTNVLHRMVIKSIAVGLRLTHRFRLSAHETEERAIEHITTEILSAEAEGRTY